MASVPPQRCSRHDLAVAPDGQCILCRRASSAIAVPEPSAPSLNLFRWLVGALVVAASGGAAAWWQLSPRPAVSEPVPAAAAPVRPALAVKPPEKTDAEALSESLKLLEQAEVERLALERRLEDERQRQLKVVEVSRKREEHERDLKRHEAVKRDLAALGQESARRNVNITMYSTSWCSACKQARAYMDAKHIAYTDLDVEHDPSARARAHALNPRGSVPTIAVDNEVLIGFSPESLETRIARAARVRSGS